MSTLVSGCSFRLPMSPVAAASEDVTGSIAHCPLENWLDLADCRYAMAAMATALDPQGNGAAAGWVNPISKDKGVFIQQGQAYPVDDRVCRPFSTIIIKKDQTERLSGSACLHKSGDWVISELKPVK